MRISVADHGPGLQFLRLIDGHLVQRIFHGLHHVLDGEDLDPVALDIDFGDQVFRCPELLARGDKHGILHRSDYDLRVDALFLAQYLDRLKDRCQNDCPRYLLTFCDYHSNFRFAFATLPRAIRRVLPGAGSRVIVPFANSARVPSQRF